MPSVTAPCTLPAARPANGSRLPFVDLLRAAGSSLILWHHLAYFGPLSDNALPLAGAAIVWLFDYSAMAVQVFLVLGGYLTARTVCAQRWTPSEALRFAAQRYARLGVPYLATIVVAMLCAAWARPWLDERTVGPPPTWEQFLAHVFFLPFLLGYDRLSAGVWYVCIDFQLGLLVVLGLLLRDSVFRRFRVVSPSMLREVPWLLGWAAALFSLFYVNRNPAWENWGGYFFGSYFMGALVARHEAKKTFSIEMTLYCAAMVAALALDWRPRLAVCLVTGLVLTAAARSGWIERWPSSRWVAFLGRISYSLFLIHFSVLLVVSAAWVQFGWNGPVAGWAGMLVVYFLSLVAATLFYRAVEVPAVRWSRRIAAKPVELVPLELRPAPVQQRQLAPETSSQPRVAG